MLGILKILLLAFFSVAVLLPVVRYLLRTLSPAKGAAITADEMRYMQKQEIKLIAAYFFFACLFAVFFAGMLALISSIIHTSSGQMHLLTPNFMALFAPGLLLGLTVALLPLRLVQNTLLHHDADLYKKYINQVEGEKSLRKYGVIFSVMLLLSGLVAWYSLRWHVTIADKGIEVTDLLHGQRTYTYKQIQSIHYLGAEGEYLVTFADQTNINTTYLKPVQLEMIALLADRSGQRVIR